MRKIPVLAGLLVFLGGCIESPSPQVNWDMVGGSRADGFIQMAAQTPVEDNHQWDEAALKETVAQRCRAWGDYKNAESLKQTHKSCEKYDEFFGVCKLWKLERTFQCTVN